jgi:hypothetical protein
MIKIIAGLFLVLHGLVHLLYYGQSARRFELKPGLTWPDNSWAFSKLIGENSTRSLAGIFCILAAAGFVIGGAGILFGQSWWRTVVVAAAAFSVILYILFWNGRMQGVDAQGGFAILIDAAILATVLIFHWPTFDS